MVRLSAAAAGDLQWMAQLVKYCSQLLPSSTQLAGVHSLPTMSTLHHASLHPLHLPHSPSGRRASKLVSLVTSCFTGTYVRRWAEHFPDTPLAATPAFDARAVLYPSDQTLRDYLSWRQADTHVNNLVRASGACSAAIGACRRLWGAGFVVLPCGACLCQLSKLCSGALFASTVQGCPSLLMPVLLQYNTCFWALVKSGQTTTEAHAQLRVGAGQSRWLYGFAAG